MSKDSVVGETAGQAREAQSTGPGHTIGLTRASIIARLRKPGLPVCETVINLSHDLGKVSHVFGVFISSQVLGIIVSTFQGCYWD